MLTWNDFAQAEPRLAQHGQRLLRVDDATPAGGLAYLATVRRDGSPRLHPISPALIDGHLYALILTTSPKQADLRRFIIWNSIPTPHLLLQEVCYGQKS